MSPSRGDTIVKVGEDAAPAELLATPGATVVDAAGRLLIQE